MEKLKFDRRVLRKFGITMAIAFFAISSLFFLRQKHAAAVESLVVSSVFLIPGLVSPVLLKPAYIIWMRFCFFTGMD